MNLQEIKEVLLKDEETKAEYEALSPDYELIKTVLNAKNQLYQSLKTETQTLHLICSKD